MEDTKRNKRTVTRFFNAFRTGDTDAFDGLIVRGRKCPHAPCDRGTSRGPSAWCRARAGLGGRRCG